MSPKIDSVAVTITELQSQIAAVEGFRVSFSRLGSANLPIEPFPYDVMAPSKWRTDWRVGALVRWRQTLGEGTNVEECYFARNADYNDADSTRAASVLGVRRTL